MVSSTVEMCRSIKVLRTPGQRASDEELSAAARQFVRKITGFHKPSKANEAAFEQAIAEIARTSRRVLDATGRSTRQSAAGSSGNIHETIRIG